MTAKKADATANDANTAEPPKKPDQPKHKIRFAAKADAQPGVREFRLVTPQGLSTVGQFARRARSGRRGIRQE